MDLDNRDWCAEQLATVELGDTRRAYRATRILRRLVERPGGRVSEVIEDAAELQAAYDFLESPVASGQLIAAFADATLRAASELPFVYVPIDGTSLTLTDRAASKGFGSIGKRGFPTRGLKVIDALALDPDGTPLGLLDLEVWARKPATTRARETRRREMDTEVRRWVDCIERVQERVAQQSLRPWFIVDREGDCAAILRACSRNGADFTVRSSQNRRTRDGRRERLLRERMASRPICGQHVVQITKGSSVETVSLDVRVGRVTLLLPDYAVSRNHRVAFDVNVVWARERRAPRNRSPLNWMLLTSRCASNYADAVAVIESYCHRWRIEDFHRTWKSGHCRVEETQLRRREHVVKWAVMHAAVATRVERLKHLARSNPDAPATIELSEIEIQALRIKKRKIKKQNETVPDGMPTILTAVLWLAQTGGYQGKSHENPGSITIGRGLERLAPFVQGLQAGLELAKK